ncbi:MAG TPA: hypothetical protein VHZ76_06755, partial [Gammaproteobacteria bacterium]|nr:hypothetical protein [Gammaproteobacteria bacterium]
MTNDEKIILNILQQIPPIAATATTITWPATNEDDILLTESNSTLANPVTGVETVFRSNKLEVNDNMIPLVNHVKKHIKKTILGITDADLNNLVKPEVDADGKRFCITVRPQHAVVTISIAQMLLDFTKAMEIVYLTNAVILETEQALEQNREQQKDTTTCELQEEESQLSTKIAALKEHRLALITDVQISYSIIYETFTKAYINKITQATQDFRTYGLGQLLLDVNASNNNVSPHAIRNYFYRGHQEIQKILNTASHLSLSPFNLAVDRVFFIMPGNKNERFLDEVKKHYENAKKSGLNDGNEEKIAHKMTEFKQTDALFETRISLLAPQSLDPQKRNIQYLLKDLHAHRKKLSDVSPTLKKMCEAQSAFAEILKTNETIEKLRISETQWEHINKLVQDFFFEVSKEDMAYDPEICKTLSEISNIKPLYPVNADGLSTLKRLFSYAEYFKHITEHSGSDFYRTFSALASVTLAFTSIEIIFSRMRKTVETQMEYELHLGGYSAPSNKKPQPNPAYYLFKTDQQYRLIYRVINKNEEILIPENLNQLLNSSNENSLKKLSPEEKQTIKKMIAAIHQQRPEICRKQALANVLKQYQEIFFNYFQLIARFVLPISELINKLDKVFSSEKTLTQYKNMLDDLKNYEAILKQKTLIINIARDCIVHLESLRKEE